jgi:3-oxoacyl-[acyl-carrier protein] reductase
MLPLEPLLETVAIFAETGRDGKAESEVGVDARFEGRVVVVTGGARGIGDTIVRRFIAEGARAVVPDVIDPAAPVAGARYLRCDITDRAQVEAAFASIRETEGRLDVLVNNAGTQRLGLTETFDPVEWRGVVDVHLLGAFNCSALALTFMRPQRSGSIVSIASAAAIIGMPGRGPYSAAKAALMSLTRVMAVEVAEVGVRVNAVAPGMTRTGLLEQVAQTGAIDLEKMMNEIPMHRLATTDEIANVVLFLASDQATYITGETIVVDGGWSVLGIRNRPDWLKPD